MAEKELITLWNKKGNICSVLKAVPLNQDRTEISIICLKTTFKIISLDKKIPSHKRDRSNRNIKHYNPDRHCGVIDFNEEPCLKVLTCNIHKAHEKRRVPGRSKSFQELLRQYQIAASQARSRYKYLNTEKYNPDRHCGVRDYKKYPCMRVITCQMHKLIEKQKVSGRTKTIEKLIQKYKQNKEKKKMVINPTKIAITRKRIPLECICTKDEKTITEVVGEYALL